MGNERIGRNKLHATVVILGMHRSGTSLTAALVQKLGVNMGEHFPLPDEANPTGYFEDLEIMNFNTRVLAEAGGGWRYPPTRTQIKNASKRFENEFRYLIEKKSGKLWGWKDPRTCLTIHALHPYLTRPHYIVIDREIPEIAASLAKRDGTSVSFNERLIRRYKQDIDQFIKDEKPPVLHLKYKTLCNNPRSTLISIQQFLNLENVNLDQIAKFIQDKTMIEKLRASKRTAMLEYEPYEQFRKQKQHTETRLRNYEQLSTQLAETQKELDSIRNSWLYAIMQKFDSGKKTK